MQSQGASDTSPPTFQRAMLKSWEGPGDEDTGETTPTISP